MAVYVDDYMRYRVINRYPALYSHLTADTTSELHAFAGRLGMHPSWFRPADPMTAAVARDHYDVSDLRRDVAIKMGAVPVRWGDEPWRQLESRRA